MLIRMYDHLSCSFFGHPKINVTAELKEKLTKTVVNLIENENVRQFLFGASTDFDALCHDVVTELQGKYPDIVRIAYDTPYESSATEEDRKFLEFALSKFYKQAVRVRVYEQVVPSIDIYPPKRICDEERNRAMVDDSDFCVFFYDKNYTHDEKLYRKRFSAATKSDVGKTFRYAVRNGKEVLNLFS